MDKNSKIYVAGHRGLVGSAIVRVLQKEGFTNLILKTKQELDLLDMSKLNALGWKHSTPLDQGIASTYEWYVRSQKSESPKVGFNPDYPLEIIAPHSCPNRCSPGSIAA